MKTFYLVPKDVWLKFPKEHFRYSHCLETDDPSKLLVAADFHTDSAADFWESVPGVETLPHVVLGMDPVKPEHSAILTALGVKPGDKTVDVARKASSQHPLFNPERF